MMVGDSGLRYQGSPDHHNGLGVGPLGAAVFDESSVRSMLLDLNRPCTIVRHAGQVGVTENGQRSSTRESEAEELEALIAVPVTRAEQLGDTAFRAAHGVRYAYATGSMANAIAGEKLVLAMGRAGLLSSFGAAGVMPDRLETAIRRIQAELPQGPWAFNLIHSPSEDYLERKAVELYIKYGVSTVEASAFLDLTPHVVRYRVAGLALNAENQIEIRNKLIAKLSRREVASKFMNPAPHRILSQLVEQGLITEQQARLAEQVPMADDVTVEADSGGHTDNRPLVGLLPSILALRDEIHDQRGYLTPIRVGAAGGISTPASALAAFMMGAAYVVTGSVNQSCLEARASKHTKRLLAEAEMADVIMAPAADMFEMGVKVQVLKRGTLFPMRAQKLYDLYREYSSIEQIPVEQREKLEQQIFRRSLDSVWADTVAYFSERDPDQITRAEADPKRKMALIFRWYLGLSSRWSNHGEAERVIDYQIWCGPSMGAFNDWARGSYLAEPENRSVIDVAHHIMTGAAYLYRLHSLRIQGLDVPARYTRYAPTPLEPGQTTPAIPPDRSRRQSHGGAGRRPEAPLAAQEPEADAPAHAVSRSQADAQSQVLSGPQEVASPARTASSGFAAAEVAAAAAPPEPRDAAAIEAWIVAHIAERMALKPEDIDIREPFESFDLDSAQVLVLADELEKWLRRRLSPTLLWNYPNIKALAGRLAEETAAP